MLTVTDLRRTGLQPCSFTVSTGTCAVLKGPSGSGKSLLLRALADLDINEGDVRAGGVRRASVPAPHWRRLVGYLPAEPGWWTDRIGDHFQDRDGATAFLEKLNLAPEILNRAVDTASTGERQRLALVRLLTLRPSVLLLDEPTSALDDDATAAVEALIAGHLDQGGTAVVVSHDDQQAERLGGVSLHMINGRLSTVNVS